MRGNHVPKKDLERETSFPAGQCRACSKVYICGLLPAHGLAFSS